MTAKKGYDTYAKELEYVEIMDEVFVALRERLLEVWKHMLEENTEIEINLCEKCENETKEKEKVETHMKKHHEREKMPLQAH